MIRKHKLTCKEAKNTSLAYFVLFIIWITLFSISASIICTEVEGRAFIVTQYLLIYQEIYYFIKADSKQQKVMKAIPIVYAVFFSGIITRSMPGLSEKSFVVCDILLFMVNSVFVLAISYAIFKGLETQVRKNRESTDSKINTDPHKEKCDKNYEFADSQRNNKINTQTLYQDRQFGKISQQKISLHDGSSLHGFIGSKQLAFKNSGANLSNYNQDRFESNLTLKNIDIDDINKNAGNTPQMGENDNAGDTSFALQCAKLTVKQTPSRVNSNRNGTLVKNGSSLHKSSSSSFLQNARNYDDQIQKSQFDISFNLGVNKQREEQEDASNNVLLQDYQQNYTRSQNTSQAVTIEPSSQPNIALNTYPNSAGHINRKSLLTNTINSYLPQNESILSSGLIQNERSNKREPTAVFNNNNNNQGLDYMSQIYKNSQIIEKSSEDFLMSELNNEYEICYNILNCVDFAAFKMDISGRWKIDFQNQAAKKLQEQNNMDVAQIFKKITNISLSKESYNTIANLGLLNNDYKFSPQIKHTSFKQSSRQSELQKYVKGSVKNKDEICASNLDKSGNQQNSPSTKKLEISVLKLPSNMNSPNFSLKQSLQPDSSNPMGFNSITSRASNLNPNSSPSSFSASMSVYQFINNSNQFIKFTY